MESRLTAKPLQPFGMEVTGDLAALLSPGEQAWLQRLLDDEGLILARDQTLTLDQQVALLKPLGPVLGDRATLNYVSPTDGILGTSRLGYHSDLAFAPYPFQYISLHAQDVVDGESSTLFADGVGAHRRLPDDLRDRLQGLTAAAVSSSANGRTVGYDIPAKAVRYDRPAILPHPRTGQPILYVNQAQTARLNELTREDSDALLATLFDLLYAPGHILEHRWCNGDLLLWDNMRLQHARPPLDGITRRRLQRVAVAEKGLFEQLPDFRPGDPTD
jgi:taurine dioxygenase